MEEINYKSNLRKVIIETVLSASGASFSVSTITIFWNSVGMDQTAIGFVQMIFTIVICLLDIPMGYIADRFNRKVLNILGDFGVAFAFAIYSFAQNEYVVLLAECLLGLFTAMTNGVDQAFIKYTCDKIDPSGKLFKKTNVKIYTLKYISLFLAAIIGGFIAKYNLRLCIGISFIPYFIGGFISINIEDYGEKKETKESNPFKDMIISTKEIIMNKKTRILLGSYILGKEITHSQIWVFTPMLIMVGVPIEIVSFGWVINFLFQILGSKLSEKIVNKNTSKKFAIPILIEFFWMIIIILNTNIVTVWLFALNGFVHGLIDGNLATSLQESITDEIQTSVMSIASTGARLLYIPLVYFVNYLGNTKLQLALVGVLITFFPLCLITYLGLKQLENSNER